MDLAMFAMPVGRIKLFAGAKDVAWLWETRAARGADGGISVHWSEYLGKERISMVHRVTVDGRTVHLHQLHIGKYGGRRVSPTNDPVPHQVMP